MIYGLILAGGIGSRMGAEIPKQFIEVKGRPIIAYTVDAFSAHESLQQVVVLVPEEWIDYTKELLERHVKNWCKIHVIAGGEMRNDTILKGIDFIAENYGLDEETIVLTHDAVRPFITKEIIDNNIVAMDNYNVCDTVIPATDTIVHSADNKIISDIPDRSKLYQGQTPQTFRAKMFCDMYYSLTEEEKMILTDAAKVFVIKGENVALVDGHTTNIKVTYPSDLLLAEAILGA